MCVAVDPPEVVAQDQRRGSAARLTGLPLNSASVSLASDDAFWVTVPVRCVDGGSALENGEPIMARSRCTGDRSCGR